MLLLSRLNEIRAAESAARRAALEEVFDWLGTKLSHCIADESLCLLCELEKGIKIFMDGEKPEAGRHKTYAEGIRIGQERMRERAVTIPQMPPRMPALSGGYFSFLSRGEWNGFVQGWKEYREKIRALEVEDGNGS